MDGALLMALQRPHDINSWSMAVVIRGHHVEHVGGVETAEGLEDVPAVKVASRSSGGHGDDVDGPAARGESAHRHWCLYCTAAEWATGAAAGLTSSEEVALDACAVELVPARRDHARVERRKADGAICVTREG